MSDEIRVDGDVAEVSLGDGHYATIDAVDVPRVKIFIWKLDSRGDPATSYPDPDHPKLRTSATLKMIIVGKRAPSGHAIKNLDGDQLNCRRSNVKLVTLSEARRLDKENYGPGEDAGVNARSPEGRVRKGEAFFDGRRVRRNAGVARPALTASGRCRRKKARERARRSSR